MSSININSSRTRHAIMCIAAGAVCIAVVYSFVATTHDIPSSPQSQILINNVSAKTQLGLPIRIKIPKIKVDAAVEQVGLTKDGAVDVPTILTRAAWFNQSPRPGEKGVAVIDGHFGRKQGIKSVFTNLSELKKGDTVTVIDDKGASVSFTVRELRTYDWNEIVPEVFTASDGKAHLNLITCQGTWNKKQNGYLKRLVVFTDSN